jgi:serine/threonine-protein kinase HipA
MNSKLTVYRESDVVGVLDRVDANNYVFKYERSWLASKMSQPLSLQLPLQDAPFSEDATKAYFANLLPEGQVRDYYASKYRVSPDDDFELLANLAGDCAGAIALYPEGLAPSGEGAQQEYRLLTEDDIERVAEQPYIMEFAFVDESEGGIRLSLAGAQDKLPIAMTNANQINLPLHGAPSTHILKPQNPRFNYLVQNELFCMTLAKKMGLNVPDVSLLKLANEDNYVVKRYDRFEKEGRVKRIHQEDFCQATGTSYRYKYEDKGGPGHSECFEVIRKCRKPLLDRIRLVSLVVYNYLICNADCHAKNISLLYDEGANPNLAPFYDLVCTAAYTSIDRMIAMSIGGDRDPREISIRSWEKFSRQIGDASSKPTIKILENMSKEILPKAEAVARELVSRYGANPIYDEILRQISHRANSTLRSINSQ